MEHTGLEPWIPVAQLDHLMYYIILLFTSILRAAFCDFFLRFTTTEYNYR